MHVPTKSAVSGLTKEQLLEVASKLGIDAEAIVESTKTGNGLEGFFEEADIERHRYSEEHPGFAGQFEFEIEIGLLGKRAKRRARVNFTQTPDGEYFDLHENRVRVGWGMGSFGLEVLALPELDEDQAPGKRRSRKRTQKWVSVNLELGEINDEISNAIWDEIWKRCKAEDAQRRKSAGLPPGKFGFVPDEG